MKEVLKNPKVSENFIEIMYCLNGECSFTSNFEKIKKIYKFNKGDIIIHRATNEIKEYEVESENLVLISIDVYLDEMIKDILEESNNRKAEEWKKKILNMFKVDEFYYGKCNEEIKILSEEINNTSVNNVGEYLTFKAKIFQFIYSGELKDLREQVIYCDRKNNNIVTPKDLITQELARNLLLFAIESFDDNLVGWTNYSIELSKKTDLFFEIIANSKMK